MQKAFIFVLLPLNNRYNILLTDLFYNLFLYLRFYYS